MWARVENNVVVERVGYDPTNSHPESTLWVSCDDTVQDGWTYANGKFSPPNIIEPPITPKLAPEFVGLGLSEEAIADVQSGKKTLAQAIEERGPL